MAKIAIFGGSFDPVHKGHIEIAKRALDSYDLKKLIFVIAYIPPHKTNQYAKPSQRLEMLKLAVETEPRVEISLYELEQEKVVYSYQTLDHFQKLYPNDEIYMVIGSDSLIDLPTWKNIDYLAGKFHFIVAKRAGVKIDNKTKYLDKCLFIEHEIENISSSKIRALLKNKAPQAETLLDEKVYQYIEANSLYN